MGYLTQLFGEPKLDYVKLSKDVNLGKQLSSQSYVKVTGPLYSFSDLEMCYRLDPLVFGGVNNTVRKIMAGGFKKFVHEKKYVVTRFTEFFNNIGNFGNNLTFEELLNYLIKEPIMFGNHFIEKIFNDRDTKIVDLAIIDPKRVDYAKKSDGSIILDEYGKPIGYMLKLQNYSPYSQGDEIPKKYKELVRDDGKSVFLLAKRIAHIKINPIGFWGVGLIEPAYKSGIYKKNMEKANANSIYQNGFGATIAYAGNERKASTPQERKEITDILTKLDYEKKLTLPHWVRVETLKQNEPVTIGDAIHNMKIDQISSLGIPDAAASGQGQTANKQTLSEQMKFWEFTLKDIIQQILSQFKKHVLKPINDYNGYGGVPDIEWGDLNKEDDNVRADKLIRLLTSKSSNITPEFAIDLQEDLRENMKIKISKKKKILPIEEEKKKEIEENKKEIKEIDSKLSKIIENIKLLKTEKDLLKNLTKKGIKSFEEKSVLDKEKINLELKKRNQEFENRIHKLNNEFEMKLNALQKGKRDNQIKKDLEKLDEENKIADDDVDRLIKEKKIKQLEKKEKLIKKLEKDLENEE